MPYYDFLASHVAIRPATPGHGPCCRDVHGDTWPAKPLTLRARIPQAGFAVRPDLDKPGFFDNANNHAVGFWGVYGVQPLAKNITLDAYYLGLDRKTAAFNRGVDHEVRHSIGVRLSRPIAERNRGWDFDYEALWQFGSFRFRKHTCRDSGIGNRLPVPERSTETAIQR